MKILVIAEHNNEIVKASTFSTINAASQIDQNIDVLVVGSDCNNVASELSNTQYIKKILLIDDTKFQNPIAENISKIITSCAEEYTHILAPASTFGKNIMPRVAALLDVAQISDIIKIEGKKVFKSFNYNIPSDISSSAFFIVLTLLAEDSNLVLKKVGINYYQKN